MKYRREGCSPEKCRWYEPRASLYPQATVRQTRRASLPHSPGIADLTELDDQNVR
jgi:hypothetical protein